METINKLLIGLVALTVIACMFIIYLFVNQNKNKHTTATIPEHPYNVCIKLFIDQSNKQGVECDFNKAKSICFELIKQDK